MIAKQLEINEVEMSLGASIKAVEVSTHCCLFLFDRTMNTLDSYTKGCGFNSGKVQDFFCSIWIILSSAPIILSSAGQI